MDCRKLPPSDINHCSPGICANAPIAASTNAISAIIIPNPKTAGIAGGIKPAISPNAPIPITNAPNNIDNEIA